MPQPNFAGYHIRKWFTQTEDTLANETGVLADGEPVRKIVIAAAVHNPYAGRFKTFTSPNYITGTLRTSTETQPLADNG